jgi:GDPmannose 4,6-dehydratase
VNIEITWEGKEENEKGYRTDTGDVVVEVDPRYYRPTEVELLLGDAAKAREILGWEPQCTLQQMVAEMVEADLETARAEVTLKANHPV